MTGKSNAQVRDDSRHATIKPLWMACLACAMAAVIVGCIADAQVATTPSETRPTSAASSPTTAPDTSDMILVPAGEFTMGNDAADAPSISKPAHRVHLRAYYIAKFEVTKEEFCRFLNASPNLVVKKGLIVDEHETVIGRPDLLTQKNGKWVPAAGYARHPVVSVTWYGAQQCARHFGKRLPTEAEWEKAARAGTTTPWFFGDDPSRLDDYAWHLGNCPERTTHEIGLKKPNPRGLYDVYGNVYEVVADRYAADYYAKSPTTQPQGPAEGEYHVRRGGSYYYAAKAGCNSWQRVSTKIGNEPEATNVDSNWGFRLAADAPQVATTRASR